MDELLKQLRKVYYNKDPRLIGENPKCAEIWNDMVELLSNMDDDELLSTLEALPEADLEIIYPAIEELAEEREDVEKFIR